MLGGWCVVVSPPPWALAAAVPTPGLPFPPTYPSAPGPWRGCLWATIVYTVPSPSSNPTVAPLNSLLFLENHKWLMNRIHID